MRVISCGSCSEIFFGHGNKQYCDVCHPALKLDCRILGYTKPAKEAMKCWGCKIPITGSNMKRYCDLCRIIVNREQHKDYYKRYPDKLVARRRRYRATENYKQHHRDHMGRYSKTEAGKLTSARNMAKRRCQDPDQYMRWFDRLLIKQGNPCAKCGKRYHRSHELDHIISLALGRLLGLTELDKRENLQVLCKDCHKLKTGEDNREIQKAKKEVNIVSIVRP